MSERDFLSERARREVADAVRFIEAQTSAEIVVAVRHAAGRYRHADYLAGAVLAFGALLLLLFHPRSFAVETMPIDVAVVFAAGAFAASRSAALRRLLTSRRQLLEEVRRSARAAFVELGVSRTKGRTGILVFVALLERAVFVVPDVGVDLGPLRTQVEALEATVPDLAAFLAALRALGAPLGRALPRAADDENELPDEMVAE
jgi:putative membrane protein